MAELLRKTGVAVCLPFARSVLQKAGGGAKLAGGKGWHPQRAAGRLAGRSNTFLRNSAVATMAFQIAPSGLFGANAPSNKLNIAGIVVGGMKKK